jgi:DNA-binding transcriptional LysR family regulator
MVKRDLDWNDLRHFLHAVQAKTLAGGARSLGVKHSTVGRRISALEQALGAALVTRGPDGLQLTSLGKKIAPLVEQMALSAQAIQGLVATQRTHVRLAMPTGFSTFFSEKLAELRRDHPEISLEIMSGSRPVDLRSGEADMAIRSGPVGDPDLVARKLCDAGFSLYSSQEYLARSPFSSDATDLSGHDIIGFDPAFDSTPLAQWLELHAGSGTTVLRGRTMIDVFDAAVSGVGVALLSCFLGDRDLRLKRLTPAVLVTHPLSLVYRREAIISESMQAVRRFVTSVLGQHVNEIRGDLDRH